MIYRNDALLGLARLAPRCFGCGKHNDGDVVAAHRNEGKGTGSKNPDYMWAALCTLKCHYEYDQGNAWNREERRAFWLAAFWKTQDWLWSTGLLVVSETPRPVDPPSQKPKKAMSKGRKLQSAPFPKSEIKREWPKRSFPKRGSRP